MDITIQQENDQPLMGRTDYALRVHTGRATPSRAELHKQLVKKLKADKELLLIKQVAAGFGDAVCAVRVSVYKDTSHRDRYEPTYMQKRHEKVAEKPAAEKQSEDDASGDKMREEPEKDSDERKGGSSEKTDDEAASSKDAPEKEGPGEKPAAEKEAGK